MPSTLFGEASHESPSADIGANSDFISPLDASRDFEFSERDFNWLRSLASEHSGIVISQAKQNMVYSRLAKRLRNLGLTRFSDYRSLLERGDQNEFSEFINALTTNLTSFFREPHHFDHLRHVVLPQLLQTHPSGRRLRIWSAGCSTGEEPYTISLVLKNALVSLGGAWDYRILATDLDTKVLAHAAEGVYEAERVSSIDRSVLASAFLRGRGDSEGMVRVKPEIRDPIVFRQLNLVQDWSLREPFDAIFCRNVIIYFDRPTQSRLFDRFAQCLRPGGYLYIGHSETLFDYQHRFKVVGKTIYQKLPAGEACAR